MGIIFFFGDFLVCGRSRDMSIRSSTSAKVSYILLVGTTCFYTFFNRPEEASFDSCFVSLPVVGLLGPGSHDKPFGGFLDSKDTCEAFEFCLLAAFAICFFVYLMSAICFIFILTISPC